MSESSALIFGESPINSTPNWFKRAGKHIINVICSPGVTAWVTAAITVFCLVCFGGYSELYSNTHMSVFFGYLALMSFFHASIYKGKRMGSGPFKKMANFFEGMSCHSYVRFHILLLGSLMVHQTAFLSYNPKADYWYLIDGVVLSQEHPSARRLPFYHPWVKKNFKVETTSSGTTADSQKLRAFVTADVSLTDDPTHWDWQYGPKTDSNGFQHHNQHAEEALKTAFARAVSKMRLSEISDHSIVLDTQTGINIKLTEIGLRLNGIVTVENVRPYFGD
mgnify:CR=1 FL=1